ncbi:hypothetical protein GCM10010256_84120 [Streptomyces coeruleorubidus]|nr:hypothetical protein GCM10010256_84120 [Streptomyces coeruleorubidus]
MAAAGTDLADWSSIPPRAVERVKAAADRADAAAQASSPLAPPDRLFQERHALVEPSPWCKPARATTSERETHNLGCLTAYGRAVNPLAAHPARH